eukprot:scaffold239_cov39-Tisochrysis_lutea.AAC.1
MKISRSKRWHTDLHDWHAYEHGTVRSNHVFDVQRGIRESFSTRWRPPSQCDGILPPGSHLMWSVDNAC